MSEINAVTAYLHLHWATLMVILGAWIALATFIARGWQKPPVTASRWQRALHFALVDLPALAATLNGKTWLGFTFSIPFITWTLRAPDAPVAAPAARTKQAGFVRLSALLAVAAVGIAIALCGCATTATKPGETLAGKIKDDQAAIQQICTDVQTQCLPQFQNPLPAIKDLAAALADFTGAMSDPTLMLSGVIEIVDSVPALKADGAASMCVIRTVVADIKKLQPAKAARLDRLVAQLEAAQSTLAQLTAPVCDSTGTTDGVCRPVACDSDDVDCGAVR